MELSVIWVKDLFVLHFKCCYWKMKMRLGSVCLLQVFLLLPLFLVSTSFSFLLEANERKISLDYFIELGQVFVEVTVLPQGTVQHLKGMKFSLFWVIFETIVLTRLCHTSMIHCHNQTHKAYSIVLIFPKPCHFKPT